MSSDDRRDDPDLGLEAPPPETGTTAADEHELVLDAATQFVLKLAENPDVDGTITEILHRYLDGPIDTAVGRRLNFALDHVIGHRAGTFLMHYLGSNDPGAVLTFLPDVEAPDADVASAERMLRRLQALFGFPAEEALRAMDEDPDDWSRATRKVYKDVLLSRWVIELELFKYNGERVFLKMTPDTATRLGAGVLVALNAVEENVFDDETVKMLFEQIIEFLDEYGATVSFPDATTIEGSDRLPELTGDGDVTEAVPGSGEGDVTKAVPGSGEGDVTKAVPGPTD